MKDSVQNRWRYNSIAENLVQLAEAAVGRQDKGALDQLYFTMDVFCVIPDDGVIFFIHKRRRNHEIRGRAIACDGDIIDHSDSKERFDINIMRMRFHGVPKKYDKIDSALGNHAPELLIPS
jgi:hypothetical protein